MASVQLNLHTLPVSVSVSTPEDAIEESPLDRDKERELHYFNKVMRMPMRMPMRMRATTKYWDLYARGRERVRVEIT